MTALALLSLASACDKMPLVAPSGSVITLIASSNTVAANGQVEIIARVIENGGTTTPGTGNGGGTTSPGAGTPVHNGTLVSFATTIGRIEPREARTQNGEVRVRFHADGQSGTARITAYSGGTSATLDTLLVGTAAAARITVTATRQQLSSGGGTTEVLARVEDAGGSPVPGVPVTFTTSAGTVNPTSAVTDENGIARTTLSTTANADVTARAGAQSGNVMVSVAASLGLSVQVDPNPATAGVPTNFRITTANNAVARDVVINFGDGQQTAVGDVSGSFSVPHVYGAPGQYPASVSATDASGNRQTQSTVVFVGGLNVTLTANPTSPLVGSPVTFTASAGNAPVARYVWTVDGVTESTTSNTLTRTFEVVGPKTVRVDVIGVDGRQIGTATLQIFVSR